MAHKEMRAVRVFALLFFGVEGGSPTGPRVSSPVPLSYGQDWRARPFRPTPDHPTPFFASSCS